MTAPSLVEMLREQGIELRPNVEVLRERALRDGLGYLERPHECRGCGQVVDAKKLDEHATQCSDPVRLARYRRSKAGLGRRSVHLYWHVRRGIIKPECALCQRDIERRRTPSRPIEEDWPEASGR